MPAVGIEARNIHGENVLLCLEISLRNFRTTLPPGLPQPLLGGGVPVSAQSDAVPCGLLVPCSSTSVCCIRDKLSPSNPKVWPRRPFSVWSMDLGQEDIVFVVAVDWSVLRCWAQEARPWHTHWASAPPLLAGGALCRLVQAGLAPRGEPLGSDRHFSLGYVGPKFIFAPMLSLTRTVG